MIFPNFLFKPVYSLGPYSFSGYFFFMGLGIACALGVLFASHKQDSPISRSQLMDSAMLAVIGGLFGGKIFHIIFENPAYYLESPWRIFSDWGKGFVIYGSFLGGAVCTYFYCKRQKISFGKMLDCMAVALPLGIAVGRLGCLCAGCCYGYPTSFWWGISFAPYHLGTRKILPQVLAAHGDWISTTLHPTQLIESLTNLALFCFLFWAPKKNKPSGWLFGQWLFLYALTRFGIEFLRVDQRSFWIKHILSQAQGISLLIITVLVAIMVRGFRSKKLKVEEKKI